MTEEYYTPSIEDIRVGYECEFNSDKFEWVKRKFEFGDISELVSWYQNGIFNTDDLSEIIKVPYLTKKQIENEGWIFTRDFKSKLYFETTDIWNGDLVDGGFLEYDTSNHQLIITTKDGGYNSDGPTISVKFKGECPSINELRFILKLIKIKR